MLRRIRRPSRPLPGEGAVVFAGIEIGQFEIGPVMQARTFGSFARRQAPPGVLGRFCAIFPAVPPTSCFLPQERNT